MIFFLNVWLVYEVDEPNQYFSNVNLFLFQGVGYFEGFLVITEQRHLINVKKKPTKSQ